MKIQSLAIIFIIIILPISLVFSEYLSTQIESKQTMETYDRKLLNSTYDAIKAYQLNTVKNAFGDVTNQKISDIEAAANTFFNSLTASFNFSGYNSNVMKEYVPGLVFTMYDGYYMYAPFRNTLTGVETYDKSFSEDGDLQMGLKPYVYYNCRYMRGTNDDFIITYTLDNYITIQGMVNGEYHYDYGYLYRIASSIDDAKSHGGIYFNNTTKNYYYGNCEFKSDETEELKEFVGKEEYSYAKIDGKKYYIDENHFEDRDENIDVSKTRSGIYINAKAGIFFIDDDGTKNYNQVPKGYKSGNTEGENKEFLEYYFAIKQNKSAYEYFEEAYRFSKAVLDSPVTDYKDKAGNTVKNAGYGLANLKTGEASIYKTPSSSTDITSIRDYGDFNIFDGNIEYASSNFEQHRKAIIRYVIETNLSAAISSYAPSDKMDDFVMPKISETDWETIQNEVCAISFLQGMNVGFKKYNGYAVIANTLTKEYVDENDIYILAEDASNNKIYCKANDKNLCSSGYKVIEKNASHNYYSGIWKINFELKQNPGETPDKTVIYCPLSYENAADKVVTYMACYSSIAGSFDVEYIGGGGAYSDMYSYINTSGVPSNVQKAYYMGLARERYGAFNINNINYEINRGNGNDYFIDKYFDEDWNLKP